MHCVHFSARQLHACQANLPVKPLGHCNALMLPSNCNEISLHFQMPLCIMLAEWCLARLGRCRQTCMKRAPGMFPAALGLLPSLQVLQISKMFSFYDSSSGIVPLQSLALQPRCVCIARDNYAWSYSLLLAWSTTSLVLPALTLHRQMFGSHLALCDHCASAKGLLAAFMRLTENCSPAHPLEPSGFIK